MYLSKTIEQESSSINIVNGESSWASGIFESQMSSINGSFMLTTNRSSIWSHKRNIEIPEHNDLFSIEIKLSIEEFIDGRLEASLTMQPISEYLSSDEIIMAYGISDAKEILNETIEDGVPNDSGEPFTGIGQMLFLGDIKRGEHFDYSKPFEATLVDSNAHDLESTILSFFSLCELLSIKDQSTLGMAYSYLHSVSRMRDNIFKTYSISSLN